MNRAAQLMKLHDDVHLINGLLRKMEKVRLKILYYNTYHKDWEEKRGDLKSIDLRIQQAIDMRIKFCNQTLDLLSGRKEEVLQGEGHGKTQK